MSTEPGFEEALERVSTMVRRHASRAGLSVQPDEALRNHVLRGLAMNLLRHARPYCPCRELAGNPEQDRAMICPCRDHLWQIAESGECECGIFVKAACPESTSEEE